MLIINKAGYESKTIPLEELSKEDSENLLNYQIVYVKKTKLIDINKPIKLIRKTERKEYSEEDSISAIPKNRGEQQ